LAAVAGLDDLGVNGESTQKMNLHIAGYVFAAVAGNNRALCNALLGFIPLSAAPSFFFKPNQLK
jgi:hypothetical protein